MGFGDPGFHAHHAIQLTICFAGTLSLATGSEALVAKGIAVAPDVSHQLDAMGLIGIVFVEPESQAGAMLSRRLFRENGLVELSDGEFFRRIDPLRHALDEPFDREKMLGVAATAIQALAPVDDRETTDTRILAIINYAAANIDRLDSLRSAAEAAGVFLSESRLRHLFVEQTGLAFKTYLLWLRLVRAVQHYSEGRSLTEAAHLAGFADSAHFSRAFKRTFGSPATTLTRL